MKAFRKDGKVSDNEMNASEPFDEASLAKRQVASKPRSFMNFGIMAEETCLLSAGCAVYRWHGLVTGSLKEREK